jgi:chorismate mutase/prephenate dehydratase
MNEELLKEMRDKINGLDDGIIRLLNERAAVCVEVGRIKGEAGLDTYDASREERIYQKLAQIQGGILPEGALREIFREIISASRALQAPMGISFLGPEASFSHQAALSHFGRDICIAPQATIAEVFAAVEKGDSLRGVVPIENSTEGSVRATLDALITTPLAIRGEIFQRIRHALLSASGSLAGIRKVYSHPQALAQCRKWLQANLPGAVLVETESTAGAALRVKEEPSAASVGSVIAAEVYRLKVLAEGIEDNPSNTTRFLIIGPQAKRSDGSITGRDKTSVLFAAAHVPGGLQRALAPFAEAGINLTRIESFPMRDRLWEYLFFVDFVGHAEEPQVRECLAALEMQTASLKVLGSYPRGIEPAESLQGKDRAQEGNGNGNGKDGAR